MHACFLFFFSDVASFFRLARFAGVTRSAPLPEVFILCNPSESLFGVSVDGDDGSEADCYTFAF